MPVVMPSNFTEEDSVYPLFGADFGETEEEAILRKRDELFQKLRAEADAEAGAEEAKQVASRKILIFGLAGVAIGSLVTGGMTALSLRAYSRSGSVMGPAIYAGIGSAAMGTAMILLLSKIGAGKTVDPRAAALAVGARMAA